MYLLDRSVVGGGALARARSCPAGAPRAGPRRAPRAPAAAAPAAAAPPAPAPAAAPEHPPAPAVAAAAAEETTTSGAGLAATVEAAFLSVFSGAAAAPRVLDSWRRLADGPVHDVHWPGLGHQKCASYLEGLPSPPPPFPDVQGPGYEWLLEVERHADVIIDEFDRLMSNPAALEAAGNSVWVPAARDDALSYGPDWRTLVLQDRGEWDKYNSKLFKATRKVLESINAPTLEVFFARQAAGTGIASHTDDVNFIQTSHLGLRVPEGECWMKCGDGEPQRWAKGRAITMDTSFMHSTWNGSDEDRYVLILRHWHHATTPLERVALQFLFDCVDRQGTRFAENKARKQLRALGIVSSIDANGGGSAGSAANGAGKAPPAATAKVKGGKAGKKKK